MANNNAARIQRLLRSLQTEDTVNEKTYNEDQNFRIPARVIGTDKMRDIIQKICDTYVEVVSQTYGPGGKDTIIQFPNGVYVTKDGWTVAQNLSLGLDADLNALGRMVLDVAANVNLKVGDATTTAILVASQLNSEITDYIRQHEDEVPMYIMKKAIVDVVEEISNALLAKAIPVDTEENSNADVAAIIRKIALVSTNWNEEYADMIADIYEKVRNPYIRVENSGSDRSYVDYIHGYDMGGGVMLRDYYVNNVEAGAMVSDHPVILMFDHTVEVNQFMSLATIGDLVMAKEKRDFVVMAPGFQHDFISNLHDNNMRRAQIRDGKTPNKVNLIPVQVTVKNPVERSMYDDLRVVLNATIIGKSNQEFSEMFEALRESLMEKPEPQKSTESSEDYHKRYNEFFRERNEILNEALEYILEIAGSCVKLTATDKRVIAEQDVIANQEAISERMDRLKGELDRKIKQCDSLSMIIRDIADYRTRISKLSCNAGVIYVGGFGDADLKSVKDTLDDAISACRAAFEFGYIVGGNCAVPIVVDEISRKEENIIQKLDLVKHDLREIISETFLYCIFLVATNYYDNDITEIRVPYDNVNRPLIEMINKGLYEKHLPYDIIQNKFTEDIIEPVISPVEVLKGSMRLVKLVATSSQYLYKNFTTEELIGAQSLQQ